LRKADGKKKEELPPAIATGKLIKTKPRRRVHFAEEPVVHQLVDAEEYSNPGLMFLSTQDE